VRPNVARGELNSRPQAWILVRPEVRAMEIRLIREHCTNDPAISYNLTPRFQAPAEDTVVPPMRWYARPEGEADPRRRRTPTSPMAC
jgi:hypothetical protein